MCIRDRVGTVLPFITPIAKAIKFGPIPMYFLAIVFLLLILYIALTTLVKKWYLNSEKYLIDVYKRQNKYFA